MRLIDADKLYPDCMSNKGLAITQSQLANAPTVNTKSFANVIFDKDELEQIVKDRVIEPIKNGELVVKGKRPQGEWILISERLPDYLEDTLVTIQINNREPKVRSGFYANGCFHNDNGDTWNWNDPEVKAWMPLPEAYKEAENENN